jgi:hypothetical protein
MIEPHDCWDYDFLEGDVCSPECDVVHVVCGFCGKVLFPDCLMADYHVVYP